MSSFAPRKCTLCWEEKPAHDFCPQRGRCKKCRRWTSTVAAEEVSAKQQALNHKWLREYLTMSKGDDWWPLPKYEGIYEVSRDGRARSLWFRNGRANNPRPIPLEITLHPTDVGYLAWTAVDFDGNRKTTTIHSAVLRTYRGPRPKRHIAGHRNGNPFDNRLKNLDWITYKENEADKRRHGRVMDGERNHESKLTSAEVVALRSLRISSGLSYANIGKRFNISTSVAHKICNGVAWRHVPCGV